MLSVQDYKLEIMTPILKQFTDDQSRANAYCVIWAIDAYATHIALEGVGRPDNARKVEIAFKDKLTKRSWPYRAIREASNATKHAIRKENAKDVKRSSDVRPNAGVSWYAYYNDVDDGATIDLDWEYRTGDDAFFDVTGEQVEGFNGIGPRIYLSKVIDAAIEAIEDARG
ncbi:MAG: hypothetical protein WD046_07935 [Paracoccaceae bacterium]